MSQIVDIPSNDTDNVLHYPYAKKGRGMDLHLQNRIKEVRLARGMTQEQLAEALDAHKTQVSYLELGRRGLTLEWMIRLSDVLDCKPSDLLIDDHVAFRPDAEEMALLTLLRTAAPASKAKAIMIAKASLEADRLTNDEASPELAANE